MTTLQRIYPAIILSFLLILCGFVVGCTSTAPNVNTTFPAPLSTTSTVERVEVFHFHRTQQCPSCIAIGNLTENTLKANFKNELASGRLVFSHVGYELPENAALAANYGVAGSSLWIGVYNGSVFHKEQDLKVWYLIDDENAYSTHLTELVTKRLNGDLS